MQGHTPGVSPAPVLEEEDFALTLLLGFLAGDFWTFLETKAGFFIADDASMEANGAAAASTKRSHFVLENFMMVIV